MEFIYSGHHWCEKVSVIYRDVHFIRNGLVEINSLRSKNSVRFRELSALDRFHYIKKILYNHELFSLRIYVTREEKKGAINLFPSKLPYNCKLL